MAFGLGKKSKDDDLSSTTDKNSDGGKGKAAKKKGDKKKGKKDKGAREESGPKGGISDTSDEEGGGKGGKKTKKKKGKKQKGAEDEGQGEDKDEEGKVGKVGGFMKRLGFGKRSPSPDDLPNDSQDHSSPEGEETPTSQAKSVDIDEMIVNLMYVLCCMYCRPPVIEPEETPEEREERERVDRIQVARKVELERLLKEREANNVKTIMYIEGDLDVVKPIKIEVKIPEDEQAGDTMKAENDSGDAEAGDDAKPAVDDTKTGDDAKSGDNANGKDTNSAEEPKPARRKRRKSMKKKQPPPPTREEILLSYSSKTSNKHSYTNLVSSSPPVKIHISSLHSPSRGASEFFDSLMSFVLEKGGWHETKTKMSGAALKVQLAYRTCEAHKRVKVRKAEREKELALDREIFLKEKEVWNKGFSDFVSICNREAKRVAHTATTYWRIPTAAFTISRHFRGYRVRIRFPGFRLRVLQQRKRRLEKSRYFSALDLVYTGRAEERMRKEMVDRLKYSRKGKEGFNDDRGGWKPDYEAKEDISIWDHVWEPPEGSR